MADVKDVLGLGPVAKAVETTVSGVANFLGKICLPAAEELGLLWRDKITGWRFENLKKITKRTESDMVSKGIPEGHQASPRIVHEIVEQGSLADDSMVQDLWAGLLTSSCTESGDDDSNLIFINILGGLTKLQARLLKFACEMAQKHVSHTGLIFSNSFGVLKEELFRIAETSDLDRLDREIDQMRSLGLLTSSAGFHIMAIEIIDLTPSAFAIHMYVRCSGSRLSPTEFFKITTPTNPFGAGPTFAKP